MSGEVPERWSIRTLGELAQIKIGGTPSRREPAYWADSSGGHPWASISDLASGSVYATKERISDLGVKHSNVKLIPPGTPLMSFKLTIGRMARAVAPLYTNEAIAAFDDLTPELDRNFLFYALPSAVSGAELDQAVKGVTLNKKKLSALRLMLPPLTEQQKIAEILTSVDDAIQATEAVIEQTKKVKQGVMNRLLTKGIGHTRFKETEIGEIPEGWEVVPAESVCETVIDCKNRTPPITDRGFAVVRTPNVRNGRFIKKNLTFTDEISFVEWTKRGKPRSGDVLITREAPVGEVCAAPTEFEFCLGQRMMLYRPDRARLDQEFLLYSLQSTAVRRVLLERAGGSTVGHVRVGDIRTLPIPIAPLEEQRQIVSSLQSIDRQVAVLEGEQLALQALKSSLMTDLLTGRTRVRINHGELS